MYKVTSIDFRTILPWHQLMPQTKTGTIFQSFYFLKTWQKHFSKKALLLTITQDETLIGLAPLAIEKRTISFLGTGSVLNSQTVADFGDLLTLPGQEKLVWQILLAYLKKNYPGYLMLLDFVRESSPSFLILNQLGFAKTIQQVSPFITLPKTWEEYLTSLSRKNRHELKRKIRKLDNLDGQMVYLPVNSVTSNTFLNLLAQSTKLKSSFLSPKMRLFFMDLLTTMPQKHLCLGFLKLPHQEISAILAFIFKKQVLLYNSGFSVQYQSLSPGLVAKALLIKKSIQDQREIFHFLRGDEAYKYDLGASKQNLYQFKLTL